MTVSVSSSSTISTTTTATFTISTSALVAESQLQVSGSLTTSDSISVGHSYTHAISSGKYGNMNYGTWGQHVTFQKWHYTPACAGVLDGTATANIPDSSVGWYYWETTS
jgi:hypothetical protein